MIGALFGGMGGGGGPQEPAYTSYKQLQSQRARLEANWQRRPEVTRDLTYFRAQIGTVRTIDDLLGNRRLLEFSLSAFQLESEIDKKAFIRKILEEDPTDRSSLASRMNDPRFRQFAQAFAFLKNGTPVLSDPTIVQTIEDAWKINSFEKHQGERNPALREAMYFKRTIGTIRSMYQILANPALASVARKGLNLPQQFAILDVDRQASDLSKRLDVAKFRDPEWVDRFVDRFLINSDLESGPGGGIQQDMFSLAASLSSRRGFLV